MPSDVVAGALLPDEVLSWSWRERLSRSPSLSKSSEKFCPSQTSPPAPAILQPLEGRVDTQPEQLHPLVFRKSLASSGPDERTSCRRHPAFPGWWACPFPLIF